MYIFSWQYKLSVLTEDFSFNADVLITANIWHKVSSHSLFYMQDIPYQITRRYYSMYRMWSQIKWGLYN